MNVLAVLDPLFQIIYVAALITGAVFCMKLKFKEGFIFFLITFLLHVVGFIISRGIDEWIQTPRPFGQLTIGEMMALITAAQYILQTTAYVVLAVGFYRMWRGRGKRQDELYEQF